MDVINHCFFKSPFFDLFWWRKKQPTKLIPMEDTLSVDTLLDACRHAGETLAVMVDGSDDCWDFNQQQWWFNGT